MASFLVLVRQQPGVSPQPEQPGRVQQFEQIYKSAKGWGKQKKQQKRVTSMFAVPQNAANIVGVAIAEASSAQEVVQDTHTFPGAPFFQFEVLPLLDFDQQMDSINAQIPGHFGHPPHP